MGKYSREFGDLAKEIKSDVGEVCRKIAFFVDQRVVLQTPVDTGEARGSWQVSYNKPITSDITSLDVNGSLAIQKAKAVITAGQTIAYPTIYIRSNKPYMERLNNGWSLQAPTNFVDKAIVEGINDGKSINI